MLLPTVNPGETPGGAPAQPASAPNAAMPVSTPAPVAARSIHPFASRGGSLHAAVNPGQGQGAPEVILDWMAHIRFNKFELQQSFGVLIFIGDVPANAEQWRSCPAFVGYHAAYVASLPELYTNCPVLMTVGSIYLNSAIAEQSGLSSFEPNVVVPYLKANLHWRVQANDRTAVDLVRLPSLEVTVSVVTVTQQPGDVFPDMSQRQYYHHITHGRPGGARQAQA